MTDSANWSLGCFAICVAAVIADERSLSAADLPDPSKVATVKLLEVPSYCEGVVFDHDGKVRSPSGKLLASYDGGNQTTSNVAFGGPHMDQLFITGGIQAEGASPGGLFRIDLKVKGLTILPAKAAGK
jgi:hypothetical protein